MGASPDGRTADAATRDWWDAEADAYQAEHGAFLAGNSTLVGRTADSGGFLDQRGGSSFVWGPEGRTEAELGVLGPLTELAGRRVLEVGAGAAQCSAWLADRGVLAVALDISVNQLRHARPWSPTLSGTRGKTGARGTGSPRILGAGGTLGLVAASATAVPFPDDSFDAAFSAYGAVQFVADLDRLLAEVARVLRPAGRWCFSVTHPIRWALPDDPGQLGLGVSGSYFDRAPYVERDASGGVVYAEFHRTLGDYVAALVRAGFSVDTLIEPEWPDWNDQTWGGWSPLRGWYLPGTLILGATLPS